MAREPLIHFLLSFGLMTPLQAEAIATCFTAKTLGKQACWLQAGQQSEEYLFLDQGTIRAFVENVEGNEVTTGLYTGGQVVLEVASFFSRIPSQEHFHALTDCSGWVLSYQQLNDLFHARPEFREFGRAILVRALATLKARMLTQVTQPAAVRYDQLLQQHPALWQHVPLKYIASYLGITNSSLSRIRAGTQ
jgi:CRP-like cAMP-binding protein